ncbi:MAG: 1-deoxy-D-xylulose-5-phosphate reductoisomerase [Nitrospinae bacterium RIFCSPLOWO2_02_FULL_39_110]|nr:MAG: 1-deoxy-D-xylulose-5-phosphate reductoisomerase [Nitrospinae bacterium RIFCSPHIGHO2_02_39_11]OGW00446.1 MAG: 1-deoxy-D-xylulose-5-phosphate reductoisomerase [Nitrospinae bacterium RIFCSPHIGHO2_12_FULL_39_42]OGW06112.1 MAG: 1-deoxy-D-xylulose-5-phosphate reductoisomerase [Nitrospinae bacterium RIFCSPLOWO2_02_39_17]OGW06811.1 MAG: 1-deoxy-D-xylulose-5-phosphate reductoisomerase [Nitrospinae bacterium RIFCSPLOWO2_02_FULL_39_110]OGW11078.1 MAG: 1-deoxy-D-xylulose-5-phosphate reductoisomeras
MKKISILGSTGSIGVNTLDVISRYPDKFQVVGLAGGGNEKLLLKQIRKFKPKIAALFNKEGGDRLREKLKNKNVSIVSGIDGIIEVATVPDADMVISAIVGAAGLIPTLSAIKANKDIALANKETLVMAGEIIMKEIDGKGRIIPVDSEHSAIFQSLVGEKKKNIKKIILTASGGPFRNYSAAQFKNIRPEDALKHPNWLMGKKITIDSATLMNKGFEVIEAKWLFGVSDKDIEVLIHPQSIIHSLVEFIDGSVIAQLGIPDMRIPISYALNYPDRLEIALPSLNLAKIKNLSFEKPDTEKFPCLALAFEALKKGGTMPAVLNAANEIAVNSFLNREISFNEIPLVIEKTMNNHKNGHAKEISDILKADKWAREHARKLIAMSNEQ